MQHNELYHVGVKGMRWGHRSGKPSVSKETKKAARQEYIQTEKAARQKWANVTGSKSHIATGKEFVDRSIGIMTTLAVINGAIVLRNQLTGK